jgi:hypothetical protein
MSLLRSATNTGSCGSRGGAGSSGTCAPLRDPRVVRATASDGDGLVVLTWRAAHSGGDSAGLRSAGHLEAGAAQGRLAADRNRLVMWPPRFRAIF